MSGRAHRELTGVEDRYSLVLVACLVGLVFIPIASAWSNGQLALLFYFSALLLLTYRVSRAPRRTQQVLLLLVGTSLLLIVAARFSPVDLALVNQVGGLLLTVYIAASPFVVGRRLWQHQRITGSTVAGALSVYLLVGIFFATLYATFALVTAEPFFAQTGTGSATDFLYFSFVTMTTVGFGDLTPVHPVAKMLAATQGLLGQIYLVTVVAVIVSNLGAERGPGSLADTRRAIAERPSRQDSESPELDDGVEDGA